MKFINLNTNTEPIAVHSCCGYKMQDPSYNNHLKFNCPAWQPLHDAFFLTPKSNIGNIEDLTIFTFNSTNEKGVFEKSMEHLGIPYVCLGKNEKDWRNSLRIELTRNWLDTVETKYVLHADSFDALMQKSPEKILKYFKQKDIGMLLNSEPYFGPYPGPIIMPLIDEWIDFETKISTTYCRFLNAGLWVAEVSFCKEFFDCMKNKDIKQRCKEFNIDKHLEHKLSKSDQFFYHWAFKDLYPAVQFDSECHVFQTLQNYNLDSFTICA